MNHIDSRYIRIVRLVFILYGLHFLIGFLALHFMKHNWHGNDQFQQTVAILVLIQLTYEAFAQFWLTKKSVWLATLISMGFILIETYATIENTGVFRSPYIGVLLGILFLAGTLGAYWPVAIAFVLVIRYLLIFSHSFTNNGGGTFGGLVVVVISTGIAIGSIIFWRHFYKLGENPELTEISKMLNTSDQQSEILIKSIADGVIVFGKDGKITLINPAAAKLTEWAASEAMGIDVHLVMKLTRTDGSAGDKAMEILNDAIKNKQPITQNLQLVGRSNRTSIISIIVSPIVLSKVDEPVGAVAVFRDITEQHRQEQQRADFISTASHEMRTPLAAIEGYLALALNDKVSTVDQRARDYLNKAHQSTEHLGQLFQDLLTSAKAEDGRLSDHPKLVELGESLDNLAQDLQVAAKKKSLKTDFIIGAGENVKTNQNPGIATHVIRPLYYVYADPDRLREVLTNLFENAVKYTDTGKITLGLTGDQSIVQLSVKDTGTGIPAEDVPHLFQKFYRVDNSATRTIGGTGLGLFISRKIVELYGGRIWVESELGKGSTFFINLPRLSNQQVEQYKAGQAIAKPIATASALT